MSPRRRLAAESISQGISAVTGDGHPSFGGPRYACGMSRPAHCCRSDGWMMITPTSVMRRLSSFSPWLRSACRSRRRQRRGFRRSTTPGTRRRRMTAAISTGRSRAHAAERHRVGVLSGARALLVRRPARHRRADGRNARCRRRRDRRLVVGARLGRGPAAARRDRAAARAGNRGRRAPRAVPGARSPARSTTSRTCTGSASRTFYVYRPLELPTPAGLGAQTRRCRRGCDVFAQTAIVGAPRPRASPASTPTIVVYGGDKFMRLCAAAHEMH